MSAPLATFNLSATVSAASGPIAIGDVVVPIAGVYYKATATNRATAGVRAQGVAVTAWSSPSVGAVSVQNVGFIDAAATGLAAGTASWVRVSAAGVLERIATPSGSDDVAGWCSTDGTVSCLFGFLTPAIVNGSGSGGSGPITSDTVAWTPTASPNTALKSYAGEWLTSDATQQTALTLDALPDMMFGDYAATVIGRSGDSRHFRADVRAAWGKTGATVSVVDAPKVESGSTPSATNPAGWAAVLDISTATPRVRVTGEAALAIQWSVRAQSHLVYKTAAASGFDPTTEILGGFWRASFASSPWAGTASAGTSGARSVTEATSPPTVGTAQNALNPAAFDGASNVISTSLNLDQFVNQNAGWVWCLFYGVTAAVGAAVGSRIDNPGLVAHNGGGVGFVLGYSTSGVTVSLYSAGGYKELAIAAATGSYHLAQVRWDGTNLQMRVDAGAWSSIASAPIAFGAGVVNIGKNYASLFANVRVLEVGMSAVVPSDTKASNLLTYVNTRYGLAL